MPTPPTADRLAAAVIADQIEADPRKPYKAIAAALAAMVATVLGLGLDLPEPVTVALTVLGAGAAAYLKGNPLRRRPAKHRKD